jgi:RNA polymerase sigma-70 factor (ECF subfamily)
MGTQQNNTLAGDYKSFEELFLEHRKAIYSFIYVHIGNAADADDLFQDVCVVLWRRFGQFQVGTNFKAWAKQVCRNVIMDFRKRRRRHPMQGFDNETMELLAHRYEHIQDQVEDRLETLHGCVDKLNFRDRRLIQMAYDQAKAIKVIAEEVEVSVQRIYKRLGTIHGTLLQCVRRTLKSKGAGI